MERRNNYDFLHLCKIKYNQCILRHVTDPLAEEGWVQKPTKAGCGQVWVCDGRQWIIAGQRPRMKKDYI